MSILVNDKNLDLRSLPLSRGREVIVDATDYEWLSQWKWSCVTWKNGAYACRREELPPRIIGGNKIRTRLNIYMHRDILKAPSGTEVDHRDGNGLHNWRSNLRISNPMQNQGNQRIRTGGSSAYKGVFCVENKWRAMISTGYISPNGKTRVYQLGTFYSEILAAQVYNYAAYYRFGEFAKLNPVKPVFPPPQIISNLTPALLSICRSSNPLGTLSSQFLLE